MRYGVLSDIHGNLLALKAAISELERAGVDAFLCLGDIVGYGARPNECVDLIASLRAVCVAGNHELIALDRLPDAECGPLALETLRWTKRVLRDDTRRFLEELPMQAEVPGGVLLTHASLRDPQLYVRKPAQADAQLDIAQSDHPRVQLLMVGHTHQQWAYSRQYGHLRLETGGAVDLAGRGICLLNPGSVGQSYGRGLGAARARFAMLDIASGRAKLHAIPYDASCCIEELRQAGLPLNALHRWQPILPMEFHRARGTLSRRVVQALRRLVAA